MTDAKLAALEQAHALGALSDDLYETARSRLLSEIAAAPAAAPAPADGEGDGANARLAAALAAVPEDQREAVLI